jgi:hypothetical protein
MRVLIEVENGFTVYRCARCGTRLDDYDKRRSVSHPTHRQHIDLSSNLTNEPIDCEFAGKRYMKPATLFDVEVK